MAMATAAGAMDPAQVCGAARFRIFFQSGTGRVSFDMVRFFLDFSHIIYEKQHPDNNQHKKRAGSSGKAHEGDQRGGAGHDVATFFRSQLIVYLCRELFMLIF